MRLTETHRPEDGDADGLRALRRRPRDPGRAAATATPSTPPTCAASTPTSPDADFRAGRAAVLRDLLAKPRLFHTAYAPRALGGAGPGERRAGARRAEPGAAPSERSAGPRPVELRRRRAGAPLAAPQAGARSARTHQLAGGDRLGAGGDHAGRTTPRARRSGRGRSRARGCRGCGRTRAARRRTCRWPGATTAGRAPAAFGRVDQDVMRRRPADRPAARPTCASSSSRQERTCPAST